MSSFDEYVCGVNPLMSVGVLDLCGVDTVVSGVDELIKKVGRDIVDRDFVYIDSPIFIKCAARNHNYPDCVSLL